MILSPRFAVAPRQKANSPRNRTIKTMIAIFKKNIILGDPQYIGGVFSGFLTPKAWIRQLLAAHVIQAPA
jgi:hypothetical protein